MPARLRRISTAAPGPSGLGGRVLSFNALAGAGGGTLVRDFPPDPRSGAAPPGQDESASATLGERHTSSAEAGNAAPNVARRDAERQIRRRRFDMANPRFKDGETDGARRRRRRSMATIHGEREPTQSAEKELRRSGRGRAQLRSLGHAAAPTLGRVAAAGEMTALASSRGALKSSRPGPGDAVGRERPLGPVDPGVVVDAVAHR